MKATPEDVAKRDAAAVLALMGDASMKATPEDVAKNGTPWHGAPSRTPQ